MHYEYLTMFTDEIIEDLRGIMKSCSDNHIKADMYGKYLKDIGAGFTEVGCGTNIICFAYNDKNFKRKVFKFPLDPLGIEDNFNDLWLYQEIPEIAAVYETHHSGMVSVQKRGKVFESKSDMQRHYKKIVKILKRLIDEGYLLVDVSPTMWKNYAKDYDTGEVMIVDGSDIFKLQDAEALRCTQLLEPSKKRGSKLLDKIERCDGKLKYDEDYKYLVCRECGHKYNPLQLRKKFNKEVNILKGSNYTTGLSDSEQKELDDLIKKRRQLREQNPKESYDAEERINIPINKVEDVILSVEYMGKMASRGIPYEIELPSERELPEINEENEEEVDISKYGKEEDDEEEDDKEEEDIFDECDPEGCDFCINSDNCHKKSDIKTISKQQINRHDLESSLKKHSESDCDDEEETEIKCEIYDGNQSGLEKRQYVTELFFGENNVLIVRISNTDEKVVLDLLANGELDVVVVDENDEVISDREFQFIKKQSL